MDDDLIMLDQSDRVGGWLMASRNVQAVRIQIERNLMVLAGQ